MMNNPLTPIFPDNYPFYIDDEKAKKEFEELFILHFLTREIGFETPYLFQQKLKAKLIEIMPYYTQLYQTQWNQVRSADAMMTSKNLTETTQHSQEISGNNQTTSDSQSSSSLTQSSSSENNGKMSNLSDGVSQSSLTDGYLTGVSQTNQTDTGTSSGTNDSTQSITGTSGQTLTETTTFTSKGDVGIQTPAYAITEWRKVIININRLILKECEDLFLVIY